MARIRFGTEFWDPVHCYLRLGERIEHKDIYRVYPGVREDESLSPTYTERTTGISTLQDGRLKSDFGYG